VRTDANGSFTLAGTIAAGGGVVIQKACLGRQDPSPRRV